MTRGSRVEGIGGRRRFFEARDKDRLRAETALAWIAKLDEIEKGLRGRCAGERRGLPFADRTKLIAVERQRRSLYETTVADTRIHGTTKRQVGKLYEAERDALLALPVAPCNGPCDGSLVLSGFLSFSHRRHHN